MCVLRSFIPSQQKKTARPRMFRHFVPSRELHSLAPLMRLSLVDLPSANSIKCCSPAASLEKQILKIRPLTGRNVRKVDGLFLFQKSKKGGQSQWQNRKPLTSFEPKRNEPRRSFYRNSTSWCKWYYKNVHLMENKNVQSILMWYHFHGGDSHWKCH